jgi:hypothetical protein
MNYTPPSALRKRRLARPKDRITDNREAFQAALRHRASMAEAVPTDYDLGQTNLHSYQAFRRVWTCIGWTIGTLATATVLAKLFGA